MLKEVPKSQSPSFLWLFHLTRTFLSALFFHFSPNVPLRSGLLNTATAQPGNSRLCVCIHSITRLRASVSRCFIKSNPALKYFSGSANLRKGTFGKVTTQRPNKDNLRPRLLKLKKKKKKRTLHKISSFNKFRKQDLKTQHNNLRDGCLRDFAN